jgi:hypothetical protein
MRRALVAAGLVLLAHGPAVARAQASAGARPLGRAVQDFTLKDQYDSTFTLSAHRATVVILVGGDREGSRLMGSYGRALHRRFGAERAVVIGDFAQLRGVPFFVKGSVRRRFQGTQTDGSPKTPVLLDWDGAIARRIGFEEHLANVYVIDRDGVLRFRAAGRGEDAEVAALLEAAAGVVAGGRP